MKGLTLKEEMAMLEGYNQVDFEEMSETVVIQQALELFNAHGVQMDWPSDADGIAMLAESANYAAKTIDEEFYSLKPLLIDIAVGRGVENHGWNGDVFFMEGEETGVMCFHDPYGSIKSTGSWDKTWSGVERQWSAFNILNNKSVRRLYKESTSHTGRLFGLKDSVVRRIENRLLKAA